MMLHELITDSHDHFRTLIQLWMNTDSVQLFRDMFYWWQTNEWSLNITLPFHICSDMSTLFCFWSKQYEQWWKQLRIFDKTFSGVFVMCCIFLMQSKFVAKHYIFFLLFAIQILWLFYNWIQNDWRSNGQHEWNGKRETIRKRTEQTKTTTTTKKL